MARETDNITCWNATRRRRLAAVGDGPPDFGGDITLPVGGDGRRLGKPQEPGFPISVKYLSVKVTLARLANP